MTPAVRPSPRPRRSWPRIFVAGAGLWVACLLTILATGNPALVPSLILLGSFLVPVTFVAWAFQTWRDEDVTTELIVSAFVVGGLLGSLGASVLESYLLHPSPWLFLGVGLIEEAAKLCALLLVTRRMARRHTRDGIVLGAAVGFGFAAFESAGYAFVVLVTSGGSLIAMVQTELLRGVLAPVGHGLWTAIGGGVLFRRIARAGAGQAGPRRRSIVWDPPVIITYVCLSILHAVWDAMAGSTGRLQIQAFGLTGVSLLGLGGLAVIWIRGRAEPTAPR